MVIKRRIIKGRRELQEQEKIVMSGEGTSKAIPALLQEKIQEGVMDMATQQLSNAEKQDEPDNAETPDVAQQSEGVSEYCKYVSMIYENITMLYSMK